jgi:transforming growth factor-beta-induced protein
MNIKKSLTLYMTFLLALSIGFTSCKDEEEGGSTATQSIYGVLSADANYSVLVAAIDRVGLKAMLDGSTDYTIAAPSDQDFELQQIDLAAFTDAEVENIIKYHIFSGSLASSQFADDTYYSSEATASTGAQLSVYVLNGGVPKFNGYSAGTTVSATNGIVHKLNGVLVPLSVREMLRQNEDIKTYSDAVALDATIRTQIEDNTNTVFATQEGPFNTYLASENAILTTLQPSKRRAIMHNSIIVDKSLRSNEVAGTHTTLDTDMVVTNTGGTVNIDGKADVVVPDIQCTDGVIHIINGLLN